MQGAAWITLLRRIPANLHDGVAVGLVTGAEIVVQQIIKLDEDFAILRGRMSGSTAEGRLMIVPYSHMTLIAVNRRLSEGEAQSILGPGVATVFAVAEGAPVSAEAAAAQIPPAAPTLPPASAANKSADTRSDHVKPPPSKSVLLARLRERLAEKVK